MRVLCLFLIGIVFPLFAFSQKITVPVYNVTAEGNPVEMGTIIFSDSITSDPKTSGLAAIVRLSGFTPGEHGFHIHTVPSCDDNGLAAGAHLDPAGTDSHQGPLGNGHLGDMPVLTADDGGIIDEVVYAPRLTVSLIEQHSVMIHADGDNYTDTPANGGGGARVACGVIVPHK